MSLRQRLWGWVVPVALSLLTATRVAAVSPQDYAQGRHLQVADGSALGVYTLPLDVLTAVNGQLAQIAFFNAAGNVVPYAFREPQSQPRAATARELPLFPIVGTASSTPGAGVTVEVTRQADGTLARMYVAAPEKTQPAGTQTTARYLVDASAIKAPIEELSFVVRPDAGVDADFMWTLGLAAGSSLDDLTRTPFTGTLAKLTHQGTHLNVASIKTPGLHEPYLAITWDGEAPGTIERVAATVRQQEAPQTTELWAARVVLDDGSKPLSTGPGPRFALVYNAQATLPLQSVQLSLGEANTLAQVDVYVSLDPPSSVGTLGTQVFSGSVYRLMHNGAVFVSDPIAVNRSGRYITVTAHQPASETQLGLHLDAAQSWPRLSVSYAPTQALFVTAGAPPFTLAYGSFQPSHALSPSELLAVNASLSAGQMAADNVTASRSFTLGSPTAPQEAWPWKRIGLWSVLVLGVGVLVVMTRGLVRRLGS